jgi:hypothetical protein
MLSTVALPHYATLELARTFLQSYPGGHLNLTVEFAGFLGRQGMGNRRLPKVCQRFAQDGALLMPAFFLNSEQEDRHTIRNIVTTLVYQLAISVPALKSSNAF